MVHLDWRNVLLNHPDKIEGLRMSIHSCMKGLNCRAHCVASIDSAGTWSDTDTNTGFTTHALRWTEGMSAISCTCTLLRCLVVQAPTISGRCAAINSSARPGNILHLNVDVAIDGELRVEVLESPTSPAVANWYNLTSTPHSSRLRFPDSSLR